MTLLTIAQNVADYTNGPRPSSVGSNTNPDAQKYLRVINKVARRLMKVYPWNDLRQEHPFTASGTQTLLAAADMPTDFDRFVPETFWDQSSSNMISGPITATEWQGLQVINYNIDNYKFTHRGGNVLVMPTIDAGASCVFEYISSHHVRASDDTPRVAFQADTDTSLLDEELLALAATYDWLKSEGLPAAGAFEDFKDYFDMLQDNENATENIAVAGDIFARNPRHFDGAPRASRTQYYGDA